MKVGILTFHRALNYGAFLQAFSLLSFIESLGHQVEIVDYWPKKHDEAYSVSFFETVKHKSLAIKVKCLLLYILGFTRKKKRKKKMEAIQKNFLRLHSTIDYLKYEDLSTLRFDALVYGSDQIWWKWNNLPNESRDWSYWGDYVDLSIRKVSYAASMGVVCIDDEEKNVIEKKLQNFYAISVRENLLKKQIQPLTSKTVYQTIDPVFLTEKKCWESLAKAPKIKKKYVLLFNLMKTAETEIVAKRKAEALQCDLVEITPSVQSLRFGRNVCQTLDAFEFIGFVKNAEFVVTSSFHGTAFSIIFEKQFYSVGMKNNSNRVTSLLSELGIMDRYVDGSMIPDDEFIDYKIVADLVEKKIADSKMYLSKNLS